MRENGDEKKKRERGREKERLSRDGEKSSGGGWSLTSLHKIKANHIHFAGAVPRNPRNAAGTLRL